MTDQLIIEKEDIIMIITEDNIIKMSQKVKKIYRLNLILSIVKEKLIMILKSSQKGQIII